MPDVGLDGFTAEDAVNGEISIRVCPVPLWLTRVGVSRAERAFAVPALDGRGFVPAPYPCSLLLAPCSRPEGASQRLALLRLMRACTLGQAVSGMTGPK